MITITSIVLALLLAGLAYWVATLIAPNPAIPKIIAIIVALLVLFGGVAWAATNLSYTNTFNLTPGDYCLNSGHSLEDGELTVTTSVVDGECDGEGETLTVEGSEAEEEETTPTPTIPTHCPQDVDYNIVDVPTNASKIYGTSGPDLIIAGSGVKVWARGGSDCVETGSGSIVHGQGKPDFIKTGTGSKVNGGGGQDTCITGFGSSETSCEL